MVKYWDISQTLRPDLPVWPEDTPFQNNITWPLDENCPVQVSKLTMSTHTGAHGDAPNHYEATGLDIASVDLAPYMGPCVIITASGTGSHVTVDDLDWSKIGQATRVLIKTYETFPTDSWDDDFRAIHPDVIERLGSNGCTLVGIDSASIDKQTSKDMSAHHMVFKHDMRILEGLVFDDVIDGEYELIALPLKITGADASPVRAILRPLP